MTSMAAELGYGWAVIDLASAAWVHELRDPHTGKWVNSPGDEAFPLPKPGPVGSVDRYVLPDPKRLMQVKSGYRNPADHPFWREHPVTAMRFGSIPACGVFSRASMMRLIPHAHAIIEPAALSLP